MVMPLTPSQLELLGGWIGPWLEVADYSWPLQDTTVLHLQSERLGEVIVKATSTSHHIRREIWAYSGQLGHLDGVTPRMLFADAAAGLLVLSYLPGRLVLGTEAETSPTVFRAAGELLARLMVPLGSSEGYVAEHLEKASALAVAAEGLAPEPDLDAARAALDRIRPTPVPLVLTHGDFQPRNWLLTPDDGLRVIDFGRAAPRHWTSELPRLESRGFDDPALAEAFFEGLGFSPGEADRQTLALERLGMALGTIVWAHGVGDAPFEEEGRAMLARAVRG